MFGGELGLLGFGQALVFADRLQLFAGFGGSFGGGLVFAAPFEGGDDRIKHGAGLAVQGVALRDGLNSPSLAPCSCVAFCRSR